MSIAVAIDGLEIAARKGGVIIVRKALVCTVSIAARFIAFNTRWPVRADGHQNTSGAVPFMHLTVCLVAQHVMRPTVKARSAPGAAAVVVKCADPASSARSIFLLRIRCRAGKPSMNLYHSRFGHQRTVATGLLTVAYSKSNHPAGRRVDHRIRS
jgi:hypothetical protein